ncbi:NAD(P)-binding protein [Nemania sp. FL0916]|nr:NAD(P)-binding protein [Nemania sp. FL0916]
MGSFLGFVYRQLTFKPKPIPANVSLRGKTALVTGASGGLGLEASAELAAHGLSRIILGVRDPSESKCESIKSTISAKNPDLDVQIWELEQESLPGIKAFADRAASLDRLDIVILNAGVKGIDYAMSKGGHELNTQVNHIGTALLSLLLLGPLQKTAQETETDAPARLTIVSSENHFWVNLKNIEGPDTLVNMDVKDNFGKGMDRYSLTKLFNVLWMRELSKRATGNIVINAVNPGFCQSKLHRYHPGGASFANLIGWTAAQGGHCLTDAATSHSTDKGAYISEQMVKSPSPFVLSKEGESAQLRIWDETVKLLAQELPSTDFLSNIRP